MSQQTEQRPTCAKCNNSDPHMRLLSYDGKIYCYDCWPGYDECADERCQHYRCEHDLKFGKAVYVKPGHEAAAEKFENTEITGCANEDCPCREWKEPDGN